ncbi:MAG: SDR family oxidoreductase [Saprospiraceae bacterium]|nr:SDR family oxidoreductase [Saprospiraceae bacterium]MCF8250727.1 SDR family oxidoreductase [Saprospiraceae bacterium]MCF8279784.1 SDR family oxidoreductase [Bacteroidales bacterium]MCF8310511.1 SDR family oxidoreductase [Saprospiraceae bacterium]MCF8440857.1 SDR family oxidoreductase [Saprospiraceae bacterium]
MLSTKKIVIIGGTSGIGLSAAQAFQRQGAAVVALGLDKVTSIRAIEILGRNAHVLTGDATEEGQAEAAIAKCIERFGGFDGLYHVAGGSGRRFGDGPLHEMTLDAWGKTFQLNLTAVMLSNRASVRHFLGQNTGGAILNMGSALAFSPAPQFFATHAYAAAKAAIEGFTKSIAAFYAPQNIRANVIAPGLTETPMAQRAVQNEEIMQYVRQRQPLDGGRAGQPHDLDGLASLLLSDAAGFITGQVVAVDGGWKVN